MNKFKPKEKESTQLGDKRTNGPISSLKINWDCAIIAGLRGEVFHILVDKCPGSFVYDDSLPPLNIFNESLIFSLRSVHLEDLRKRPKSLLVGKS